LRISSQAKYDIACSHGSLNQEVYAGTGRLSDSVPSTQPTAAAANGSGADSRRRVHRGAVAEAGGHERGARHREPAALAEEHGERKRDRYHLA
jgi:hypothetical protein